MRMPRPSLPCGVAAAVAAMACAAGEPRHDPSASPTGASAAPRESIAIDVAEGTLLSLDVSPDGRTIVFDLLGQLWLAPASGGAARALTDAVRDTALDLDPSFAPDGRRVAFVGERAGRRGLWLVDTVGGRPAQLAQLPDPFSEVRGAAWSPDGMRIALARVQPPDSAGARRASRLALLDVETRAVRDVSVAGIVGGDVGDVAWTPDGRRLVFSAGRGGDRRAWRLWVVDAGGGAAVALERGRAGAFAPAVAPDGRRVAYIAADSAGRPQVWVHAALGGGDGAPRRLTDHEDLAPTRVRWSPDGHAVLYAADGKLWRADATTGAARPVPFTAHVALTRQRRDLPAARFPEPAASSPARGFMGLALSPDARLVGVLALGKLWVVPVGGAARAVADVPHTARHLAWAPDGSEVAWSAGPHMSEDLYATDVRSGATRRVTALHGRELLPAYSPDGRWLAFVHADSTTRLRVTGARGRTVSDGAGAPALAPGQVDWTGSDYAPLMWSPASDAVLQVDGWGVDQPATGVLATLAGDTARVALPDAPTFAVWVRDSILFVRHDRLWAAPFGVGGVGGPSRPLGDAAAMYASAARDGTLLYVSVDGLRLRSPTGVERRLGWPIRYTAPAAPPLLVRGVRIVDGTGAPATPPRDVLVERGRIARIAPAGSLRVGASRVLDAGGRWAIPGLMDLHAHTYLPELLPGFLAFGVTLVRDQGSAMAPLAAYADAIAAGVVPGPRVSYGAFQFYSDWPYDDEQGRGVEPEADPGHLARALDLAVAFGAHHVKTRTFRRWDIDARIVAEAHRRGLRVTGHCVQPLPLVAAGIDAKEHIGICPIRGAAGAFDDMVQYDDVNRLLRAAGIAVVPTISYFAFPARLSAEPALLERDPTLAPFLPPRGSVRWMLQLDSVDRADHLRAARRARATTAMLAGLGVTVGTGTDIWQIPTGVHLELEELVAAGLSPARAIRAATGDAARIVGAERDLGTIAVGKRADLVLLDADPLADIRNTRRIRAVVQDGWIVDRARIAERFRVRR